MPSKKIGTTKAFVLNIILAVNDLHAGSIGWENSLFGLTGCTTIISPFRNKEKEIIGAIGVIGPMRLNYAKIIPVVDFTANMIGKKFQIT